MVTVTLHLAAGANVVLLQVFADIAINAVLLTVIAPTVNGAAPVFENGTATVVV